MEDWDLLNDYIRDRSEEAFAALVGRYVDLVYSAAIRQINDPDQARDVTQAVFLTLARKAGTLKHGTILSGWLYRTARFVALEAVRTDTRRKRREEAVFHMNELRDPRPEAVWKEVAPHIDSAMEHLNEPDRAAVLLRFFHERSLREVAGALGISEEAAKKRVSRALERLRDHLTRQGISSSSSLLTAAIAVGAVQTAPTAMGATISAAISSGSIASAEILSKGALHMIAWTKFKTTAACAAVALLATGTITTSVHHARVVRDSQSSQALAAKQLQQATLEEAHFREAIAAAESENKQLQQAAQHLHQLRNTVAQLQKEKQRNHATTNRIRLESAPPALQASAETLRELQFQEFIAAGRKALALEPLSDTQFPTSEYVREINLFKNLGLALRIYASKHQDQFPRSLDELLQTDLLTDSLKKKVQEGPYEYHVFSEAESKPNLPALWWEAPDTNGIRMLVLNDGSVHRIREPKDVPQPGFLDAEKSR